MMKLKLNDNFQAYFSSDLNEVKGFDQSFDTPEREFEKVKVKYERTFSKSPQCSPTPLSRARKLLKNPLNSRRNLDISDSETHSGLQKAVNDLIMSGRNHYKDKLNLKDCDLEAGERRKHDPKAQFESYNDTQKRVDRVVKNTLDLLKNDLNLHIKDLEVESIIHKLCPTGFKFVSPRKKFRSPHLNKQKKSAEIPEEKTRGTQVSLSKKSASKTSLSTERSIKDKALRGFEKTEKPLTSRKPKEIQEKRQESLEVYYRVKEKTQMLTDRYLSKLTQESMRLSAQLRSRDNGDSNTSTSPPTLSRILKDYEESSERSLERKSPNYLLSSPLYSPGSASKGNKQSPRNASGDILKDVKKMRIKVFSPGKKDGMAKQKTEQILITQSNVKDEVEETESSQKFNFFFGSPHEEYTSYEKLMTNIGLGLLPLYEERTASTKGLKLFKKDNVGLPVAKLTAKDVGRIKEKMDVDLKSPAYKNLVRPQDVVSFNTPDIL